MLFRSHSFKILTTVVSDSRLLNITPFQTQEERQLCQPSTLVMCSRNSWICLLMKSQHPCPQFLVMWLFMTTTTHNQNHDGPDPFRTLSLLVPVVLLDGLLGTSVSEHEPQFFLEVWK